jgi:hypothetical protein
LHKIFFYIPVSNYKIALQERGKRWQVSKADGC